MKHYTLVSPLLVDRKAAGIILGKSSVFDAVVKAGWVKPVINQHSCKLFERKEVEAVIDRLKKEALPDRLKKEDLPK